MLVVKGYGGIDVPNVEEDFVSSSGQCFENFVLIISVYNRIGFKLLT